MSELAASPALEIFKASKLVYTFFGSRYFGVPLASNFLKVSVPT